MKRILFASVVLALAAVSVPSYGLGAFGPRSEFARVPARETRQVTSDSAWLRLSRGEVATKDILDCGAYAACYWGCVAGGGGLFACGDLCNGGGAGQGRCY